MTGTELRPEYGEPEDQQHQENHGENIEQETGDVGGSRRNAGEAEKAGDDRHQKEDQRPFENCHGVLRDLWGTPMAAHQFSSSNRGLRRRFRSSLARKSGSSVLDWLLLNQVPGGILT